MKFATTRDVDVPVEYLFERATDFAGFERRAVNRGVEVRHLAAGAISTGFRWQVAGFLRGRPQQAEVELIQLLPPDRLEITATSGGLKVSARCTFAAISPRNSRLEITIDAQASTLRTRLMLHSLRLARGRISKRIKTAIGLATLRVEEDFYARR